MKATELSATAPHGRRIAVVGLGYVGLPLAVAFGKKGKVLGFDVNAQRVQELRAGHDRTNEVTDSGLRSAHVVYSSDAADLAAADFVIVAVPTPINGANRPDLGPIAGATRTVAQTLRAATGDRLPTIVVYESTVYPGVTEEVCVPLLEKGSGLVCGRDFFVGYSPERINPGDRTHTLENIMKIVSGQTPEVLEVVAEVYGSVVAAGVHRAVNIKTAEAAKVIENTQRDLNIALVNELSLIFDRIGIDTLNVLEAAGTKWNFLPFRPGLVGGHCIGVDPYYLTHKAEELGYHPQVILAGRKINDSMAHHVAEKTIKMLVRAGVNPNGARVGVLGVTFKEDVPDLRNSKVQDILADLRDYSVAPLAHDPHADPAEYSEHTGTQLAELDDMHDLDAVVLAVAHKEYKDRGASWVQSLLRPGGVVVDLKGLFRKSDFGAREYWRL